MGRRVEADTNVAGGEALIRNRVFVEAEAAFAQIIADATEVTRAATRFMLDSSKAPAAERTSTSYKSQVT